MEWLIRWLGADAVARMSDREIALWDAWLGRRGL